MDLIYTFIGSDESYNLVNINKYIETKNIEDYEIIKFDLSNSNISKLLEELNMYSFFHANKVVILYGLEANTIDDRLINYIHSPNPNTYLFISIKDNKYALYEELKRNSIIVESNVLKSEEFESYTNKLLKKNGYSIDNESLSELVNRCNNDYNLLNINLDKLMTYKYDTKVITLTDINTLITKSLDDTTFDLVKEVIRNNKLNAYNIYLSLKEKNIESSLILSSLIYKFREMYITKKMSMSNATQDEIAEVLNLKNPKQAYYLVKDIKNMDFDKIKDNLNYLLDLDYKSKVGIVKLDETLELFLLK